MTKQNIPVRELEVYWNNTYVGKLMQNTAGSLSFTYDQAFLQNSDMAISISLPLQAQPFEGDVVKAFFSGLLPEESVRARLARFLGLSDKNAFALLQAVGGECAGALALFPAGEQPSLPTTHDIEILDDKKLVEILYIIKSQPLLAGDDGLRLSLAGAQDKLAVGFENGHITLMKNGQPTTHILKPVIGHVTDSVHNEFFCMRLAKMVGLDVPFADMHFVNGTPYYIVERYDRTRQKDGGITRIHQEDFCQAMGILPELKYEREGGPTIAQCQQIITRHSAQPAADQIKLLDMVIFNYLIGNADAHGKNFSLLYHGIKPVLAPAYDLLSTTIYPQLSAKMAMKIGGKYDPDITFLRHWHRLVPETRAAQTALNKRLYTLSNDTLEKAYALKDELEKLGVTSPVFADICAVIQKRTTRVKNQLDKPE